MGGSIEVTPIRITDETKVAARARWVEMWGEIDRAGEQMIDDILEAAAPLIAAQVLRSAVDKIATMAERLERSGDVFDAEGGSWLREAIDAIEGPRSLTEDAP